MSVKVAVSILAHVRQLLGERSGALSLILVYSIHGLKLPVAR